MDKRQQSQSSQSDEEQHLGEELAKSYITDARQYLQFSVKDKKIKVMDEINPIFNNVFLKDISLHKKGPLEDKIYSKVEKYYKNIRRGNTLCQIYHPDQQNKKEQAYDLFFCRRGMKKFYDLQPDYLKVGAILQNRQHFLMKKRVFEGLEEELNKPGGVYHLHCLFKENGEHCQISYVKELESWLFASKNVAILARTPDDLVNHYHKERFYWAKLIGDQFFNILDKMSKNKQEEFKKDIEGFTLLGEHCGNQKHQHITKYEKVEIIFYGLVKNVGADHCQSVEECRHFLNKYNLKMSRCKQRKNLKDKNSIMGSMWQMLKDVAEGTMAEEGEGSVMYMVCQREGVQRTVGMCKLKTCQYLIYRRLRQMLKLNVARKGSTANNFQKYKFQIEELVKHYFKPPKRLQFYFLLGEKAFKECGVNEQISESYLRYKFVEFISKLEEESGNINESISKQKPKKILIVCLPRMSNLVQKYCKGKGYEIQTMYRANQAISKPVVHILYMIPRLPQQLEQNFSLIIPEYRESDISECIAHLEECKDLTRSQLITFIKSEDKAKAVKILHEKIEVFRKNCKQNKINFKTTPFTEEALIQAIKGINEVHLDKSQLLTMKKSKFTKTFILPLLIPGSGKSTLVKKILNKKSNIGWKLIDSDEIRRKLMQSQQKIDLNQEESNKIFHMTGEAARNEFNEQLIQQINKEPSLQSECVFIDRLFSPFNIEETIQVLMKSQKEYINICVLSQAVQSVKLNDKTYPYSLHYLLTCLKRCVERGDHQTMPNNPYLIAKIVIKFYQMMANFSSKPIENKYGEKVHFVYLPLIEDNQQNSCVNQQLKKKVEECLSMVQPGFEVRESNCFIELVEALYKYSQFKETESFERYDELASLLEKSIGRV